MASFIQTELVLVKNPSHPAEDGPAAEWAFLGSALTANTLQWYGQLVDSDRLYYARWVCAWNPRGAGEVRLVQADSGPSNIVDIATFSRNQKTPLVDAVDITATLKAIKTQKTIGHQGGNGAPLIYSSVIELVYSVI